MEFDILPYHCPLALRKLTTEPEEIDRTAPVDDIIGYNLSRLTRHDAWLLVGGGGGICVPQATVMV